ncbi:hypothetical protein KJK76_001901, partial [Campylobacter jejuni]|nr:hypothetical protein [Campylobacter jejuni]
DNFINSGTISSRSEGVFFQNTTIGSLNNSGTINSSTYKAIEVSSGTSIENFNNSGRISGSNSTHAINLASGATIDNFTNSGSIIGGNGGNTAAINLVSGSNIKTFDNKGFIHGEYTGIIMKGGTIDTLKNSGTLHGWTDKGISMVSGATINQIDNSGIIESVNQAIAVRDWYSHTKVGTIKNSGSLIAVVGIVGLNADIDLIENSGTIIGERFDSDPTGGT